MLIEPEDSFDEWTTHQVCYSIDRSRSTLAFQLARIHASFDKIPSRIAGCIVEVFNWKDSALHLHFKAKFLLRRPWDQQLEKFDLVSVSCPNMAIIHADFFGRSEFKWTHDILLV